jgi:H+/Cl- antiporter ClcA
MGKKIFTILLSILLVICVISTITHVILDIGLSFYIFNGELLIKISNVFFRIMWLSLVFLVSGFFIYWRFIDK